MSQKSKVLALKYRPSSFGDLIGQDTILETIINSIKARQDTKRLSFYGD